MASDQEISDFLKNVEKRAFKRTVFTVQDDEAALDIVQDAMIRLAEKYSDRPISELPPLFQRILSNATMDWFRRKKVRQAIIQPLANFSSDQNETEADILETLTFFDSNHSHQSAFDFVARGQTLSMIEAEISCLPDRQREAFLLRYWEEFDVAEAARAMGCSEGSVKTHCSRAVHALAKALKAKGISL